MIWKQVEAEILKRPDLSRADRWMVARMRLWSFLGLVVAAKFVAIGRMLEEVATARWYRILDADQTVREAEEILDPKLAGMREKSKWLT